MWRLRILASRFRGLFERREADAELGFEIDEHLRALEERFVSQGLSPADAKYAARRQFGNILQLQGDQHQAQGIPLIENWLRDFSLGIRLLRKKPAFSCIAVGVLALGIGANTAVYSVAKAVVFAPLPFPRADRLVLVFESDTPAERYEPGQMNLSSVRPGIFQDWHEQSRSFESMAAVGDLRATILQGDRVYVCDGNRVGAEFFQMMGVPAHLGRNFVASDYAGDGAPIIVLADRMWRERYNSDPSIIGRNIVLNGASHQVIGVMPPGFLPTAYGEDPQFWIPLRWGPALKYSFVDWGYFVYARLKDGVTFAQAQAEMTTLAARMRDAHPADIGGGAIVAPLSEYLFTGHQRLFTLLLGAVALVLLIACANVGNLLLARALERRREFVVRSALGASRGAIVRQVLAESLVVAIAGGLAGAALSPLLTRSALALLPAGNLPRLDQVRVDASVLGFTTLISILAGLLLAIIPAIRAGRGDLSLTLRSGGRGASTARSERRLSDALMVAEVALSLTLLVGAGLLTQAFLKLMRQDPGFLPEQSVAVQLSIPNYRYGAYEEGGNNFARQKLYRQLEESVGSIGGVQAEGLTVKVPMLQFWNPDSVGIEGRPPALPRGESIMLKKWGIAESGQVDYQTVSPGYFAALRIPLIRGRLLDRQDQADAPFAAVVNQAFVRKFFADEDPIGRRIAVDRGTAFLRRMTIVGVVADARLDAMDQRALPEVFAAIAQLPSEDVWIVVRASGSTDAIASALQNTVHAIDPEIGIVQLNTMTKIVDDSLWRQRFSALLMGLFAALAAVIAAGGLYAVMSQAVERREPELGVRLALGATSGQIARIVLAHGFWISAVGLAIGGLLTIVASPLLGQQTYRVSDLLWMYAAVACFLLILTLISCWVPMRRALAVDPVATFRSE